MKTGRTSAAAIGLLAGLVLGAWIDSEMTTSRQDDATAMSAAALAVQESRTSAAPSSPKRITRIARKAESGAADASAPEAAPKLVMTIPVSAPELHARMKPVLARGTKLPLAVEGFSSAEQFATVAHASRNTQVAFILLKHRVLTEGQSLEDAIRASNPGVDARTEALKAVGEARGDMLALRINSASGDN